MSDRSSSPMASTSRGTTERRAALDSKNASKSSNPRLGKRPMFLGAEDEDDDVPFDFDAYARPSATNSRKRPTEELEAADRLGDGFDDLFNLDNDNTDNNIDDALRANDDLGDLDGGSSAPIKKRRVVAKMDETRLLGPTGFPKLKEDVKRIKIKGKGHEAQDLKRVLSMYQMWTHQMYPKTNLQDTLTAVEKLCHKRSLQKALKGYKEEWKNQQNNAGATGKESTSIFDQGVEEDETGIFAGLNKKGSLSQTQPTKGQANQNEPEDEVDPDLFEQLDEFEMEALLGNHYEDTMEALAADVEQEEAARRKASGDGVEQPTRADESERTQKEAENRAQTTAALEEDYDQLERHSARNGQEEEEDAEAEAAMREMEELLG